MSQYRFRLAHRSALKKKGQGNVALDLDAHIQGKEARHYCSRLRNTQTKKWASQYRPSTYRCSIKRVTIDLCTYSKKMVTHYWLQLTHLHSKKQGEAFLASAYIGTINGQCTYRLKGKWARHIVSRHHQSRPLTNLKKMGKHLPTQHTGIQSKKMAQTLSERYRQVHY